MNTNPTRLYRFQIEGPVSRGVLSAIDEADQSSVRLVHIALEGVDSGKKLEALEQLATDRACECFTNDSQFYFVARSAAECAELMRVIEARGLGSFTEPDAVRDQITDSIGTTTEPLTVPSTLTKTQSPTLPTSRLKLLMGVAASLVLILSLGAISLISRRQPRPVNINPPKTPSPQVQVSQQEQQESGTRPADEVQSLVQSPKSADGHVSNQTTPQPQAPTNGELLQQSSPVAPVVRSPQPGTQEKSPTANLDQVPSVPNVQNAHVNSPPPPLPPKIRFSADSTLLKLGETTWLRWDVAGASEVRLEPNHGRVDESGSLVIRPMGKTLYTLYASGPGGEANAPITVSISGLAGPATGELIWTGTVSGTQLVTIDHDHADVGTLEGALPQLPCIIQPTNEKKVGIVAAPSPTNNYDRLVLRVIGKGSMRIVIDWAVQY